MEHWSDIVMVCVRNAPAPGALILSLLTAVLVRSGGGALLPFLGAAHRRAINVFVHIAPIAVEYEPHEPDTEGTRDDDAEHDRDGAGRADAEAVKSVEGPQQQQHGSNSTQRCDDKKAHPPPKIAFVYHRLTPRLSRNGCSLCRWPRQARLARRAPVDDRRSSAIGQYVTGDLVLPGEPDISLALGIGQEAVERAYPARMAGDSVVQARHHHAPPMRALLVKLVELVAQRLLVSGGIPADEGKRHDVGHGEGIRGGGEGPPRARDDERLVVARLVDVIEEAEILQRLQDVDGVAHPVGVPADRLLAGDPLDRLDAVGDEALFLSARELVGVVPYPAVSGRLVTPAHDLLSEIGRGFDRLADHERAELDPVLVHEVEHARDALVMAVGEEGVGRQVRDALLDRVGDDAAGAGDRLPAALEH